MISPDDFFTNLAASLAYGLLQAGAARLQAFVSGLPEEQALRGCYQSAFAAMLSEVTAGLDADRRALVEDILRQFVVQPQVAEGLLALALEGDEPLLPDHESVATTIYTQLGEAGFAKPLEGVEWSGEIAVECRP